MLRVRWIAGCRGGCRAPPPRRCRSRAAASRCRAPRRRSGGNSASAEDAAAARRRHADLARRAVAAPASADSSVTQSRSRHSPPACRFTFGARRTDQHGRAAVGAMAGDDTPHGSACSCDPRRSGNTPGDRGRTTPSGIAAALSPAARHRSRRRAAPSPRVASPPRIFCSVVCGVPGRLRLEQMRAGQAVAPAAAWA